MYQSLKEPILSGQTITFSEEYIMNTENKGFGKLALLQLPESKRNQLIKQVREKLRQRAIEAKMLQELLQVDDLTINGNIVWKVNQQPSKFQTRKRKK